MKKIKLPVTKHELSKISKTPILGEIIIDNIKNLGFSSSDFLQYFQPLFDSLPKEKISIARFVIRKRSPKLYVTRYIDKTVFEDGEIQHFPVLENNQMEAADEFIENHFMGTLMHRIFQFLTKKEPGEGLAKIQLIFLRSEIELADQELFFPLIFITNQNTENAKSILSTTKGQQLLTYKFEEGDFIFYTKNKNEEEFTLNFSKGKKGRWVDLIGLKIDFEKD